MGDTILCEFKDSLINVNSEITEFSIGDTVKVTTIVKEGKKEREQNFEGVVICKKGSGIAENFTVRRVSYGIGIEKIFPIHSPNTKSVKVIRRGRIRRAKLYYLRNKIGKQAKIKELRI